MRRKSIVFGLVLLGIGLFWYFLIKPQDYQIRVKTKSNVGIINQSLKAWNATLKKSNLSQLNSLGELEQMITFGDSAFVFNWHIFPETDSTSLIKVDITDTVHSLKNKLLVPLLDTDFEKRSRSTVKDFIEVLNAHLKDFKVEIVGIEDIPSKFCACIENKSLQNQKALKMMEGYPLLNSVVSKTKLRLDGVPLIETTSWNTTNDSISFNFCYPIFKTDSLPQVKDVIYKELTGSKALKAIYNGNYIISDRSWYTLLDFAKRNNLNVEAKPIEFFFNNPNMGDDELRWKAEVYMPLKVMDE